MYERVATPQRYTSQPTKICEAGSIILSVRAPVGTVGKTFQKICLGRGVCGITSKNIEFMYQYLLNNENSWRHIEQGGTFTAINSDDIKSFPIILPTLPEQEKIAAFLSLVDARIEKQRQLVEALKKYKRGLLSAIFDHISGNEKTTLGSICNITTGKLDANAMVAGGAYRFYTCAKEYFQIDTYAFDTDALLISGNGANVGYIHHYNGKFNAYQRTYVLDSFKKNIMYIYYYLEAKLHPRIEAEKKAGNTPYIVLSTLSDMEIIVPNPTKQESIAQLLCKFDKFIKAESYTLELYQKQKDGLLQQMFI